MGAIYCVRSVQHVASSDLPSPTHCFPHYSLLAEDDVSPQVAGGGEGADPLRPHHVVRHVQQLQRGVDAQHLGQQRNAWRKGNPRTAQ